MKRKMLVTAVAAIGLGMMASVSMADAYLGQVDLTWAPGYYSNGYGGEFNSTLYYSTTSSNAVIAQASVVNIGSFDNSGLPTAPFGYTLDLADPPTVFETFCIQAGSNDVNFSPGNYYAGVVETTAHNFNSPPGDTQTLNDLTRTLYAEFSDGTLANYNYALGAGRNVSAGELQAAIWVSQGDYTNDLGGIDAALSEAGLSGSAAETQVQAYLNIAAGSDPNYSTVQILGLYDNAADAIAGGVQGIAQAQLVEVYSPTTSFGPPVPLPASANEMIVLLGGLGLLRLVRRARRLA